MASANGIIISLTKVSCGISYLGPTDACTGNKKKLPIIASDVKGME